MSPEDFGLEKRINFKAAYLDEIEKYILNCKEIKAYGDLIDILTEKYIITIHYFADRYICNIYEKTQHAGTTIKSSSIKRFNIKGINSFHQILIKLKDTLYELAKLES